MAVTDLMKVQIGQQADLTTAANATAILMGVTDANLTVVADVHQVDKGGWYYPNTAITDVTYSGEGSISMDLSYEDLPFPLDNLFDEATPVGTVYTYTAPTDTRKDPNYYTIEFGSDDGTSQAAEFQATGALFTELHITGEAGGIWTGTFPFVCTQVDDEAMTAALADRSIELIRMSDTVISFDNWGTAASTAAASDDTLVSFSLDVMTGTHLKTFAGDITPTDWGDTQWSGTLTTVLEHNAVSDAIIDAAMAPAIVQRAIAIEATGPVSASYAYIHFYGTLDPNSINLFDDRDGNAVVSLQWIGTYQPTQADWLEIIVDNGVAAIP